jgi:light-regulated signal transduction histidine kinase (bacteriophytochrome)
MFSLPQRSRLSGYAFTLACLAAAAVLSWGTGQVLDIQAPLFPFSLAVVFIAWFGGVRAGLLGTAVGAVMLFGVFRGDLFTFLAIQPGVPLLVTFSLVGIVTSVVVARAARDYAVAKATRIERLSGTNQSLEQFARSAADSLRTPLRAIGVFAELLEVRHAAQLDNESKEYLRIMVNSVRQMNGVIDGLREYARATQPPAALLLIDSNLVLRQAIQQLQPEISAAGATITYDALPTVRADEGGLFQVIQSLLGNALKYRSDAAPRIHISAQREAGEWIFSLADNGMGLDRTDAETVFDLFRRMESNGDGGGGIGLAICRATLERFGGRIWVESRPGAGSTFYFALPAGTAPLVRTAGN